MGRAGQERGESWSKAPPGGELTVDHPVGRDLRLRHPVRLATGEGCHSAAPTFFSAGVSIVTERGRQ